MYDTVKSLTEGGLPSTENLTCNWLWIDTMNMQYRILCVVSPVVSDGLELAWHQVIRSCRIARTHVAFCDVFLTTLTT